MNRAAATHILLVLCLACGPSHRPAVEPERQRTEAPSGTAATPAPANEPPPPIDWSAIHPEPPSTFRRAKKRALQIYGDHRFTLYCACPYAEDETIDTGACGYVPRNAGPRARRIEWEHIAPASAFGRHRTCWREKACTHANGKAYAGRACCAKAGVDDEFRRMESDLQNLAPAIGELNADRSDRPYGEVDGERRAYGACDFEVDLEADVVEPPPQIRGDVARATLYMHLVYGSDALPLTDAQLDQLWAWHEGDPPDDWERQRDARIARLQGVGNPLVGTRPAPDGARRPRHDTETPARRTIPKTGYRAAPGGRR